MPEGTNTAASFPVAAQSVLSSAATVGSSPYTSSPTGAVAITARKASEGRVIVSDLKSIISAVDVAVAIGTVRLVLRLRHWCCPADPLNRAVRDTAQTQREGTSTLRIVLSIVFNGSRGLNNFILTPNFNIHGVQWRLPPPLPFFLRRSLVHPKQTGLSASLALTPTLHSMCIQGTCKLQDQFRHLAKVAVSVDVSRWGPHV